MEWNKGVLRIFLFKINKSCVLVLCVDQFLSVTKKQKYYSFERLLLMLTQILLFVYTFKNTETAKEISCARIIKTVLPALVKLLKRGQKIIFMSEYAYIAKKLNHGCL